MSTTKKHAKVYNCTLCDFNSGDLSVFTDHMLTHSRYHNHACDRCTQRFSTKSDLDNHIRFIHSDQSSKIAESQQKKAQTSIGPRESVYACPHCDITGLQLYGFLSHASKHTGVFRYICNICEKACNHDGNAKTHAHQKHKIDKHSLNIVEWENPAWPSSVRELYPDVPSIETALGQIEQGLSITQTSKVLKVAKSKAVKARIKQATVRQRKSLPKTTKVACEYCDKDIAIGSLPRHWSNFHPEIHKPIRTGVHICSVCFEIFPKIGELYRHFDEEHAQVTTDRYAECPICNDVVIKSNMARHKNMRHPGVYELNGTSQKIVKHPDSDNSNEIQGDDGYQYQRDDGVISSKPGNTSSIVDSDGRTVDRFYSESIERSSISDAESFVISDIKSEPMSDTELTV